MRYSITCTCGEKVSVDAENDEDAASKMMPAMDQHVAAKEHPDVPKDMTEEQKKGMIQSKMQKE